MSKFCTVKDCNRPFLALGYCHLHYDRSRKGIPLDQEIRTYEKYTECSVPDCGNPHLARSYCSKHYERFMRYGSPFLGAQKPSNDLGNGLRRCDVCGEEKDQSFFYKRPSGFYKRQCLECDKRDKRRSLILIKYGAEFGEEALSIEERMVAGEPCEICGEHIKGKMAIDHDHDTGKPCGLLCSRCNVAIGILKDSEIVIQSALEYVRRTR